MKIEGVGSEHPYDPPPYPSYLPSSPSQLLQAAPHISPSSASLRPASLPILSPSHSFHHSSHQQPPHTSPSPPSLMTRLRTHLTSQSSLSWLTPAVPNVSITSIPMTRLCSHLTSHPLHHGSHQQPHTRLHHQHLIVSMHVAQHQHLSQGIHS